MSTNEKPSLNPALGKPGLGYDVLRWPEFVAFATRLGIPLDQAIRTVTIHIPYDDVTIFDLSCRGSDTKSADGETEPSPAVDITTAHNEQFKTSVPNPAHFEAAKAREKHNRK